MSQIPPDRQAMELSLRNYLAAFHEHIDRISAEIDTTRQAGQPYLIVDLGQCEPVYALALETAFQRRGYSCQAVRAETEAGPTNQLRIEL